MRSRTNLSLFLLLILLHAPHAEAAPLCSPETVRQWAATLFHERDRSRDFIAEAIERRRLRDFDFETYFQAKEKFSSLETLPVIPKKENFEARLAWLESAESRALSHSPNAEIIEGLPRIQQVLESGNVRQKQALARWSDRYGPMFEKGFTQNDLGRASADLSLILHDSRLDIGTLTRFGRAHLTENFLKSEVHSQLLEGGLAKVFGEDLIRKEVLKDHIKNFLETGPAKWTTYGALNTGLSLSSRYVFNAILITLPKRKFVRIATEDLAEVLLNGWEKAGPDLMKKYSGKINRQIAYNTIKNGLRDLSYGSMAFVIYQHARIRRDYQKDLEQKRHRSDEARPASSPSEP